MTPADQARVDQMRAELTEALVTPCSCGLCPSDEQIRGALALRDEDLLELAE